jgi:hypothetical protein
VHLLRTLIEWLHAVLQTDDNVVHKALASLQLVRPLVHCIVLFGPPYDDEQLKELIPPSSLLSQYWSTLLALCITCVMSLCRVNQVLWDRVVIGEVGGGGGGLPVALALLAMPRVFGVPLNTPSLREAQSLALRELVLHSTDPQRRTHLCELDPHLRTLLDALHTAESSNVAVLLYILANLTDPASCCASPVLSLQPDLLHPLLTALHTHRLTSDPALALSCSRLLANLSLHSSACAQFLKKRGVVDILVDALQCSLQTRPVRIEELHTQLHLLRALLALVPTSTTTTTTTTTSSSSEPASTPANTPPTAALSAALSSSPSSSNFHRSSSPLASTTIQIDIAYLEALSQRGIVKLLLTILKSSLPSSLVTTTAMVDLTTTTTTTTTTSGNVNVIETEGSTSSPSTNATVTTHPATGTTGGNVQALRTLHTTLKQLSFSALTHVAQVKTGMDALSQNEHTLPMLLEMSDLGTLFLLDTKETEGVDTTTTTSSTSSLLPPQVAAVWPLLHQLLTSRTFNPNSLNAHHAATLARALTVVLSRSLQYMCDSSSTHTMVAAEAHTLQMMTLTMLLSLAQHSAQMRETIVLQDILTSLRHLLHTISESTASTSFPSQHRLLGVQLLAWLALSKQAKHDIRTNGSLQLLVKLLATLNTNLSIPPSTTTTTTTTTTHDDDNRLLRDHILLTLLHLSLSEQNRDAIAKLNALNSILTPLLTIITDPLLFNKMAPSLRQTLIYILRLLHSLLHHRMY